MPILKSRLRKHLRLLNDLCHLHPAVQDQHGKPLLDDPDRDPFLSPKYSPETVTLLRTYGLKRLEHDYFAELLKMDLRRPDSKMHSETTNKEWHTTTAKFLSDGPDWLIERLRPLSLLLLRDGGGWTSAESPAYFSRTQDIVIPPGLGLPLLNPNTENDPTRKTLFKRLGVSEMSISSVRYSILGWPLPSPLLRKNLVHQLHYLYRTHGHYPPIGSSMTAPLKVTLADDKNWPSCPRQKDMYLPGENHDYSPATLLAPTKSAPGMAVSFIHIDHMCSIPVKPKPEHPSWKRWLYDFVGIRERLRVVSRNGDSLSEAFLYVLEHRPEKFLGLLEYLWPFERSPSNNLREKIMNLPAKDLCGLSFPLRLRDSWLPLQNLRDSTSRYMEHPDQFPFLKFQDTEMTEQFATKWSFLSKYFSVKMDGNLEFLLEILRHLERSCPKPSSICQTKAYYLYADVYIKLASAQDQEREKHKIAYASDSIPFMNSSH